jgi:hypothetical protein
MTPKERRILESRFVTAFEPGHFHSPLPDMADVERAGRGSFGESYCKDVGATNDAVVEIEGIRLNADSQLSLLRAFAAYQDDVPFYKPDSGPLRYRPDNDMFNWGDVVTLYCMMRHFRPRSMIEVGSGYSSAVMLDTAERFLDYDVHFTFIEPFATFRRCSRTTSCSSTRRTWPSSEATCATCCSRCCPA